MERVRDAGWIGWWGLVRTWGSTFKCWAGLEKSLPMKASGFPPTKRDMEADSLVTTSWLLGCAYSMRETDCLSVPYLSRV